MPAITAQLYGDLMVVVTLTGFDPAHRVDVFREPPSSPREVVRGGVELYPGAGPYLLVDPAPELGRPLIYVAQRTTGGGSVALYSSAPVTVPDPGRHVLSDPYTGDAVLVDLIATPDDRTQSTPHTMLKPKGRKLPIALYDVRGGDEGEIVVYTRSAAETADLVELLDDGGPIVSRHPFDGCDVPGSEVLFLPAATRSRRSRSGDRLWPMPFVEVALPDPTLAKASTTLADLAAYVPTTLADIATQWPGTLLDIARDPLQ